MKPYEIKGKINKFLAWLLCALIYETHLAT